MKIGESLPPSPAARFERQEQKRAEAAEAAKAPLMGASPLVSPPGPDDVGRFVNTKA